MRDGLHWEIGLRQPLQIRSIVLSKLVDPCRVLYVSDIHLRPPRSSLLCYQVLRAVSHAQPDIVLLGGDLLDRKSEVPFLTELVKELSGFAPVFAIAGNHDIALGSSCVRSAIESGGGHWLHDSTYQHRHGNRIIYIAGPESISATKSCSPGADADVRILCAHNPRIWRTAKKLSFDLVLAGHLHGCQLVAFEFRDRLYPGAWFYPYCYLTHRIAKSILVVSRGVSDLFPVRWQCPREVILCLV